MIDKETLKNLARVNNLTLWQQEKHYIQSLILTILSEESLIFKGGTYLWFFHGLKRFSEDLDFTVYEKIGEDLPKKVSKDLEMFGVNNKFKITSDFERGFSFRISAEGPLHTSNIDLCHVYIEISEREKVIKKTNSYKINFPVYNTPIKFILGMDLEEIGCEKIRAIMTRDKPRDVYDLWYLINMKNIKFNKSLINAKMKYYKEEFNKNKFIKKLNKSSEIFEKKLKPLVFSELPTFEICYKDILKWIG